MICKQWLGKDILDRVHPLHFCHIDILGDLHYFDIKGDEKNVRLNAINEMYLVKYKPHPH